MNKKPLKIIFIVAVFCLSLAASNINAQTSEPNADEVQRAQLVSALERAQTEVKASRKLIDAMKDQIVVKEKRIRALDEKDVASASAIAGLQSEIKNLRRAIDAAQAALEVSRREVAELKKQRDDTRRKLRRARTLTKYLVIAAGVLGAGLILK